MKPAPFAWHGPETVDEAVEQLAEFGSDGKVLAGGQSLIPVLAMRLAEPAHLIDINRLAELDFVTTDAEGVTVGALARHARVHRDAAARERQPLLAQGLRLVAHATIRNRGTTVGSLAHADPAGEMTAVLALTGGTVIAASARGERRIDAADFFVGALESALAPDELAVRAHFPPLPAGGRSAFVELSRRQGDYALCGVGAVVVPAAGEGGPDGNGTGDPRASRGLSLVRCAYLSVAETPVVADLTDAWADREGAVIDAVGRLIDPVGDIHATADYRRHLAGVLTIRAIRQALTGSPAGPRRATSLLAGAAA